VFVKPKPGVYVRDPDTRQHLPESGREVQPSAHWLRRLADGDVVVIAPIPDSSGEVKP
jgi:hypothetical protein